MVANYRTALLAELNGAARMPFEAVETELSRLVRRDQVILRMKYMRGMTPRQISLVLGESEESIEEGVDNAIARLRERLRPGTN